MKVIQTKYAGCFFRSRLEARWAVLFDMLGIEWEYEKEGYDLGEVGWYLPDFFLPHKNLWVEVKGQNPSREEVQKLAVLCRQTQTVGLLVHGLPKLEEYYYTWCITDITLLKRRFPIARSEERDQKFFNAIINNFSHDWVNSLVECPLCGFRYVHFREAPTITSDNYSAWDGSGDAVRIPMYCEHGCNWTVFLGLCRGQIWFKLEDVWQEDDLDLIGWLAPDKNPDKIYRAIEAARSARFGT